MTYSSDTESEGSSHQTSNSAEPTAWTGWILCASTLMVMLGSFHAFQGLVALFDDGFYIVGKNNLAVHVDYTTWGWVHLILGSVIAFAGVSLFAGRMWARIVAVATALVSSLVNIAFLAAFPIWSTIMIALDIVIIWAVTVHGREMKSL